MASSSATAGNAAGSPGAGTATSGYRLSGADVTGFRGRRVQIVGTLVEPGAAGTAATGAAGTATNTGSREFRVQSVQPISGSCPQQ
jgi:hypothetical protein